jgi:hypothetical protein
MDENESVSPTEGIDELISDQLGPTESDPVATAPETSSEPPPSQVAQEPSQTSTVAPSGSQTAATATEPTPQTYQIGGQTYTAQEIEAWKTSAQQLPHLQKIRLEEQQKYVAMLERAQQAQGQQPQQDQVTPEAYMDNLKRAYEPILKDYVSKGLMSSDFVNLFPNEAAQMVHYERRFSQAENVMKAIAGEIQGRTQREQSSGLVNDVARNISNLAQSGEAFAPLKDPAKTQEFFNYLWELNPQVSQLRSPDFLARQYVAFNKDQYLQSAQQKQAQATRTNAVRYARADATGGTRAPGVNQEPPKTPLDEMVEDFLDRSTG